MLCAKCNYDNPADALFCMKCGAKVEHRCASCNTANPADANFCRKCGASLAADAPAKERISSIEPFAGGEGERRHLTVLFCDLVNSTEIAAGLDPEDWGDIARQYQRFASEAVTRFGGHVDKYLGDGLVVYFGYPQPHEDDVERAIRAGLAILDALAALNERLAVGKRPKLAVCEFQIQCIVHRCVPSTPELRRAMPMR